MRNVLPSRPRRGPQALPAETSPLVSPPLRGPGSIPLTQPDPCGLSEAHRRPGGHRWPSSAEEHSLDTWYSWLSSRSKGGGGTLPLFGDKRAQEPASSFVQRFRSVPGV